MKLYYARHACSLAVRILLHEIGIDCEYEAVDLATHKTATGTNFYHINPKGSVPTLALDDGNILTENSVIQQYLAEKHHATQLFPPNTDFNHYRVLEWLNFVSADLHKGSGILFYPYPDEVKENLIKPTLKKKLNFLEQHLQQNKYLLGNQYTLPDGYLFVILSWLPGFKMPLENWPNISRYFNDLKTRKSVQQSIKEENLSI